MLALPERLFMILVLFVFVVILEHQEVCAQFTNSEINYILKQCSDRGLNEDEMAYVNNEIDQNLKLKKEIGDLNAVGDRDYRVQTASMEENLFLNFRKLVDYVSSIYSPEKSEYNSILTKASIRHNKINKSKYVMNTELMSATKDEESQLQQLRGDMEEMVLKVEKYMKLGYVLEEEGKSLLAKTYEYYDDKYNRIKLGLNSLESTSESNDHHVHIDLKAYIEELLWKYQINKQ